MTDDHGLLTPGSHRASALVDDRAVVAAMVRVEAAWLRALAKVGVLETEEADRLAAIVGGVPVDVAELAAEAENAGNPVVPLVRTLRDAVEKTEGPRQAALVHRGLTSQDVLDTALMLVARDALARVASDLSDAAAALTELADRHRASVMPGRTLTQHAVPITFGLKAAQWLTGLLDARDEITRIRAGLPVQCGGAAGTLSLVQELTGQPLAAADAFAAALELRRPDLPWHTQRRPVTRVGDALVAACDAVGVIATDVALLGRPEIAELRERAVPGRGGSSTMPHKRNPVLSVLVRAAALQAPSLCGQLHTAAVLAVDERPDGAWHSEWPAYRRLLEVGATVASQAAELVGGLQVDADAMAAHAREAADELLAESGGGGDPSDHLGAAEAFVDAAVARARSTTHQEGPA